VACHQPWYDCSTLCCCLLPAACCLRLPCCLLCALYVPLLRAPVAPVPCSCQLSPSTDLFIAGAADAPQLQEIPRRACSFRDDRLTAHGQLSPNRHASGAQLSSAQPLLYITIIYSHVERFFRTPSVRG